MTVAAVVLDLDGVILKTNLIKYRAMLSLFAAYPDLQPRISDYILAHGGVPRREKFSAILRDLLQTPPTEALLTHYLQRYASALEEELAAAPVVEGIETFLATSQSNRGRSLYVSSSAPEAEVARQLARRGLNAYFTAVYGSQTPKAEALRQVAAAHPAAEIVFFGDAIGDLNAAQEVGVAFVGVINERDNFAQHDVVKHSDFTILSAVERCVQNALQRL